MRVPSLRDTARGSSGAAIVELALAIPVFMLLLLGVIGYGSSIQEHAIMMQAARFGAYAAANRVPPPPPDLPPTPVQIKDTAVTLARSYLDRCGLKSSTYRISVRPMSELLSDGTTQREIAVSITRDSVLPAVFVPFKSCAVSVYAMHGPIDPETEIADPRC